MKKQLRKIDNNLRSELSKDLKNLVKKYDNLDCEDKVHCEYCPLYWHNNCMLFELTWFSNYVALRNKVDDI